MRAIHDYRFSDNCVLQKRPSLESETDYVLWVKHYFVGWSSGQAALTVNHVVK